MASRNYLDSPVLEVRIDDCRVDDQEIVPEGAVDMVMLRYALRKIQVATDGELFERTGGKGFDQVQDAVLRERVVHELGFSARKAVEVSRDNASAGEETSRALGTLEGFHDAGAKLGQLLLWDDAREENVALLGEGSKMLGSILASIE
jgi:hypothetical protein